MLKIRHQKYVIISNQNNTKKQRFSLLWLIQQLVGDIKQKTEFSLFRQTLLSEFPHVSFELKFNSPKENYLLLIDDTMHYKSMRKEIRTLARNNELGFFVTYFQSTIDNAISRNRNRSNTIDDKHLQRIFDIIEPPTDEDGEIIHINISEDHKITTDVLELFALKCIGCPLKTVLSVNNPPIEQTKLHKVDLILRKSINGRMKKFKESNVSVNLSELAKALCAKRLFILNEIKMGSIVLPENVDDLSFLNE